MSESALLRIYKGKQVGEIDRTIVEFYSAIFKKSTR